MDATEANFIAMRQLRDDAHEWITTAVTIGTSSGSATSKAYVGSRPPADAPITRTSRRMRATLSSTLTPPPGIFPVGKPGSASTETRQLVHGLADPLE